MSSRLLVGVTGAASPLNPLGKELMVFEVVPHHLRDQGQELLAVVLGSSTPHQRGGDVRGHDVLSEVEVAVRGQ